MLLSCSKCIGTLPVSLATSGPSANKNLFMVNHGIKKSVHLVVPDWDGE